MHAYRNCMRSAFDVAATAFNPTSAGSAVLNVLLLRCRSSDCRLRIGALSGKRVQLAVEVMSATGGAFSGEHVVGQTQCARAIGAPETLTMERQALRRHPLHQQHLLAAEAALVALTTMTCTHVTHTLTQA